MKKTAILAALAAGVISATAGPPPPPPVAIKPADPCLGPISYNNWEILYAHTEFDDVGGNSNGGVTRFEYSSWENFYIAGGGAYHEVGGVDLWSLSAGVGGYVPLSENVHLVGEVGVLWTSFETEVFVDDGSSQGTGFFITDNEEEWGWYVRPHLRAKWGCFEMHVGAIYNDVGGDWDDEWEGFVSLYYQVAPQWDITAGVAFASETTTVTGGARYRY